MKKNHFKIYVALVSLLYAFCANAQSNDSGRPVWVVGHACNSQQCLIDAINDGATGVEIDVHTDAAHKDTDWSVNHGTNHEKYLDKTARDKKNTADRRTGTTRYVSLEEYLKFDELRIQILWLDVKSEDYLVSLVKYVHKILGAQYGTDEQGCPKQPFAIIYGIYKSATLTGKEGTSSSTRIAELTKLFGPNEGINMGYEGKKRGAFGTASGSFEDIEKILKGNSEYSFPIEKHFMTCGWGAGFQVRYSSTEPNRIREAKKFMMEDKYCSRIGFWTCTNDFHGLQLVCSKNDYPKSYETECDLILMECRTEFYPVRKFPGLFNPYSVNNFCTLFFLSGQSWYDKYNKGKYRRPYDTDKFYIKYSDPSRVKL